MRPLPSGSRGVSRPFSDVRRVAQFLPISALNRRLQSSRSIQRRPIVARRDCHPEPRDLGPDSMLNLLTFRDSNPRRQKRSDSQFATERRSIVVCHPIWELAYGGLERQLAQVLPRISDGFDHTLLPRGATTERRQPIPPGVALVEPSSTGDSRRTACLAAQIRQLRPDVVHVRGLGLLLATVSAARQAGDVPVVFSFHGLERVDQRLSWFRRPLIRRALLACNQRWAVSRATRDWIAAAAGLPLDRINVIPNGVDTESFIPCRDKVTAKIAIGLPPDRPLVLSVGNIKPIKGHHVLMEAARLYRSSNLPITAIVGAEYRSGQPVRLEDSDASGVRLVGRHSDVRAWYNAADLFVLPSLFEGLSNALLEAMACGLPVVATDVGGNPDLVHSGRNGILVPPGDATSLGLAIRAMLADPARRQSFGDAARATVVGEFGLDLAARRTAAAYRRAAVPASGVFSEGQA